MSTSTALRWKRMWERSPASVVAEMKEVVSRYDIRHFYIVDDVLTLYPERIVAIADGIARLPSVP